MQIPVVAPPAIHIKKTWKRFWFWQQLSRQNFLSTLAIPVWGRLCFFCTEVLASILLHPRLWNLTGKLNVSDSIFSKVRRSLYWFPVTASTLWHTDKVCLFPQTPQNNEMCQTKLHLPFVKRNLFGFLCLMCFRAHGKRHVGSPGKRSFPQLHKPTTFSLLPKEAPPCGPIPAPRAVGRAGTDGSPLQTKSCMSFPTGELIVEV